MLLLTHNSTRMRERRGKQQYDFKKKKAGGEKAPVGKIKSQPYLHCRMPKTWGPTPMDGNHKPCSEFLCFPMIATEKNDISNRKTDSGKPQI